MYGFRFYRYWLRVIWVIRVVVMLLITSVDDGGVDDGDDDGFDDSAAGWVTFSLFGFIYSYHN